MRTLTAYVDNDNDVEIHNLRLRDSTEPITDATVTATLYEVLEDSGTITEDDTELETDHEFTAEDIGKSIVVGRAGTNGADLFTVVADVTDHVAELADPAESSTDYGRLSLSVEDYEDVTVEHMENGTYRFTIESDAGLVANRGYWIRFQISADGGTGTFSAYLSVVERN